MSVERYTLDTNLLIYSVDVDAGERHLRAMEIVDRAVEEDCALTLQALGEFFHAATRKAKMPLEDAEHQVSDWCTLFPLIAATPDTLPKAISAVKIHGMAFWDAMLWATAKSGGVRLILTEDFQHGRDAEGVRFINPFV